MTGAWKVPSQPRIGKPYTAHYTAGPGRIDGLERVLCDEYLMVSKGIPAKHYHPRCATCAGAIPAQLDLFGEVTA